MALPNFFQIEPLGHRSLQRPGKRLVAQDEIGHLRAQRVGIGDFASRVSAVCLVVFQFEHVLEDRKAAFGARNAERLREVETVVASTRTTSASRSTYSADDLRDEPVLVERRAVVAQKHVEPVKRRARCDAK